MLAPKEDQRWSPAFRAAAHPTWFLRLDPDIERSYGRVDFAVDHHRGLVDELRAHGDPFEIHVHYHRWDERRQVVYSDHANVTRRPVSSNQIGGAIAHSLAPPAAEKSRPMGTLRREERPTQLVALC